MLERDIHFLVSIFCDADDFCKEFEPEWRKILVENQNNQLSQTKTRNRKPELSLSEAITIAIIFHKTGYRTLKDYYTRFVMALKQYFPKLISYSRFITLMKTCLFPLFMFSQGCLGKSTGLSFVDSTILTVCHPRRIHSHRVFQKMAKRGKTSTGWFYGFNMSLVDKILLRKRGLIECVNNKLKSGCQIEHHRHRSRWNFLVNLISGIVAYAYDPCKPCVQMTEKQRTVLFNLIAT
jgi:DDE family transposase